MIKINDQHDTSYFSSNKIWLRKRNKTFFKTLEQVEMYQQQRFQFLENYYNLSIKNTPHTNKIPNLKYGFDHFVTMTRSGTTSNNNERNYYYSSPEQSVMDEHHIWKIEKSHDLLHPGDIIWISAKDYNIPDDSGRILGNPKKNRLFGPTKYANIGPQNNVYELFYNAKFKKEHWEHNLNIILEKKIKFLRASPSVIETIYYHFKDQYKFNFPVILSEETLQESVRLMAERMFSKVIDKCVSWDGCLGWFECPYKTKHIYDEFCKIEQLKNNVLSVTDLHNLACPFFNYINGDKGSIGKINCECGIAGNYFKTFEGKIIESVYITDDVYLPGRYLHEKLSQFFRVADYDFKKDNAYKEIETYVDQRGVNFPEQFVYKIKQKENLEIEFLYNCDDTLNSLQIEKIMQFLNVILWQNKNCKKINFIKNPEICLKTQKREKYLSIESDYIKNIVNKKNL
jgi:hypothetical protein